MVRSELKVAVDPNFLVIGAQKCATTWLDSLLTQHNDIFTPPSKELHFFNIRENQELGIEWYRSQFAGHSGETAIGECTPNYLWVSDAPADLHEQPELQGKPPLNFTEYPFVIRDIPALVRQQYEDLQLIVCLRNPVDRAVSGYFHAIRAGKVSPRRGLIEAGGEQGILGMGFYYRHLVEWMKHFSPDKFLVLIYEEDVLQTKEASVRKVYEHLGVDPDFTPTRMEQSFNRRASHTYMHMHYYMPRLTRRLNRIAPVRSVLHRLNFPKITVSEADMEHLRAIYARENKLLEELLGRSLAKWR